MKALFIDVTVAIPEGWGVVLKVLLESQGVGVSCENTYLHTTPLNIISAHGENPPDLVIFHPGKSARFVATDFFRAMKHTWPDTTFVVDTTSKEGFEDADLVVCKPVGTLLTLLEAKLGLSFQLL